MVERADPVPMDEKERHSAFMSALVTEHYVLQAAELLTTAASMIAFTNSVVAGAGVTLLLANLLGSDRIGLALPLGAASAVAFMALFIVYQRRRYRSF